MAMKKKLSVREYVYVASMLFGMFFGAGNLIFPVAVGQEAGRNVWQAAAGLMITGVGLPLLGVAALGISRSKGLYDLSSKAGRPYGLFFTCLLYLTIGPFLRFRAARTRRLRWGWNRFCLKTAMCSFISCCFPRCFLRQRCSSRCGRERF